MKGYHRTKKELRFGTIYASCLYLCENSTHFFINN